MFIKLTNAVVDRRGDPILININSIVSVFENHVDGGSLSTVVYSNDNLVWHVEESFKQVQEKISAALK